MNNTQGPHALQRSHTCDLNHFLVVSLDSPFELKRVPSVVIWSGRNIVPVEIVLVRAFSFMRKVRACSQTIMSTWPNYGLTRYVFIHLVSDVSDSYDDSGILAVETKRCLGLRACPGDVCDLHLMICGSGWGLNSIDRKCTPGHRAGCFETSPQSRSEHTILRGSVS